MDEVVQSGRSAVGPVPAVVGVAPGGGDGAAGERAVLVSGDQRAAYPDRDEPGRPADVQGLGGGGEDGGGVSDGPHMEQNLDRPTDSFP
jgi:hypothetical protein